MMVFGGNEAKSSWKLAENVGSGIFVLIHLLDELLGALYERCQDAT